MALSDQLNGKTEQQLIDDGVFINALVGKLAAGAGAIGIYTKKGVDANLAKKANTVDVYTKNDANTMFLKTGDLATKVVEKAVVDVLVPALATVGTDDDKKVYTKTEAGSTFLKTADLKTKAAAKDVVDAITTSPDFTGKVYTKTAADTEFLKTGDLATKVAKKSVVEAIFDATDSGNKISDTKIGATFAKKIDLDNKVNVIGDNATEDGVNAMLDTLTGDSVVVKINASNLTDAANQKAFAEAILPAQDGKKSILVNKLGEALDRAQDNADDKVYGTVGQEKIAKEFLADKYPFVKTVDLGAKVAEKAVVDVLVPALATVGADDTKKVYTKTAADTALADKLNVNGSNATDPGVTAMLGKLIDANKVLNINGSNATDPGVTAMLGKLIDANKVLNVNGSNATDPGVTVMLGKLIGNNQVVKANGDNATEAGVKAMLDKLPDKVVQTSQLETLAVAGKVLDAKDGNKSILVEKLGGFLDATDTAYGAKNGQTAKVFLGGKGLKGEKGDTGADGKDGTSPSAAEIANVKILQDHVAKISIQSPEFKRAVQEEMSQPSFDIPPNDDAALNWTW